MIAGRTMPTWDIDVAKRNRPFPIKVVHRWAVPGWTSLCPTNMGEVDARIRASRPRRVFFVWCCLTTQFVCASPVPGIDGGIAHCGKGFLGQVGRERFSRVGVLQRPVARGILDEGHMFLGPKQNLERFPSHKAFQGQRGRGWSLEVVVARLQCVLHPQRLPDVRYGLVGRADEE